MKRALRDALVMVALPILWLAFVIGVYCGLDAVESAMGMKEPVFRMFGTLVVGVAAGGFAALRIGMSILEEKGGWFD